MKAYYQDEYATLYHGDCREILPQLDKVDLVLTDPPYGGGLSVDYADRFKIKAGKWWNKSDRAGQHRHTSIVGDDQPFEPSALLAISSKHKIFWGGNWYASRLPDSGGWWIWDKRGGTRDVSSANWPMSEAELAWTDIGKGVRVFRHTWFGLIRDSERDKFFHPTQKPIELMKWCIQLSKTAGVILDPFGGSGTTLVAAKQLNRKAIGIEIEEKYCEIAANRLRQSVMTLEIPQEEVKQESLI